MPLPRRTFLHACGGALAAAALPRAFAAAEEPAPAEAPAVDELIVDTHQHLWDLSVRTLPWLPKDGPLARSYTSADYAAAVRGYRVRAVYMEVDVAPDDLAGEAADVLALCRGGETVTEAAVLGARPAADEFAAYLDRFREAPEIKGVRRVLHGDEPRGACLAPEFVRGVRLLGERGLRFDLCMRPGELADARKLTELCPDTRFVLDHCGNADPGWLAPADPAAPAPPAYEAWRRDIDALAARPNLICKISGIIARAPAEDKLAALAPLVNHCLDAFGPDRVIFGGDWPVCLLGGSLAEWIALLAAIIADRPAEERRKLWSGNAVRFYDLPA